MIGQGGPHRRRAVPVGIGRALFAAALLSLLCVAGRDALAQPAEPSTMRLRITFGGGEARVWSGWITLSDGQFRRPQLLGLEPDQPGSMGVGVRVIQIRQRSPRSYDGLDVDIHAPLDATLNLRLTPADSPDEVRTFEFTLTDLIKGVHPVGDAEASQIDGRGNRLVISRAPGDQLRVLYDRPTLIFQPDETFRFAIAPHRLGITAGEEVNLKVRVISRQNGAELYTKERNARVDDNGSIEPWGPHDFVIPKGDGVYEMIVAISKPRLLEPFVPTNPLTSSRPVLQRRLQFVAIDNAVELSDAPRREQLVDQFDPVVNNWGERVGRWPLLKHIPRMKQGKLTHGKSAVARHLDRQWMQMAPDAWQAYPLSIDSPGEPHILEVEYPDDIPQTLGISLLEPNALDKIAPLGVDTAVEVTAPAAGTAPKVGRHRLLFWPKTSTPIVLLTSHDSQRSAIFGKVRAYRVKGQLSPEPFVQRDTRERIVGAWLEKPIFPEMFGAQDAADRVTARNLDDWRTFYQGAQRFAQHLQYAGYNTAVVPALCEGSALYPSELLEPTPKYDTGIFLSQGHDPQRKDVMELMFRIFDRAGLTLMPSVQFNTPLPELELLRGGDARTQIGLELIDPQGRTWLQRRGARSGLAPHYNPLDARVQAAMTAVVRELTQRYGHHPSFGGVVLQLAPDGYAMLPGDGWGYDDRTFASFAAEMEVEDPGAGRNRFAERALWCNDAGRAKWLAWRAQRLTMLYRGMAAEVRAGNDNAQLLLAGPDMLDSQPLRRVLRPTLAGKKATEQQVREALLETGIDPELLRAAEGVALVAPHLAHRPEGPMVNRRDDHVATLLHKQLSGAGSLLFRSPATKRVASFDAVSPFGAANTYTWLAAQVSPAGDANRRRLAQCLARDDQQIVFDGGWMLPRGQEVALSSALTTLRRLPVGKLNTVPTSPDTQPITLRTGFVNGETIAVLVNDSPWPVTARVAVDTAPDWNVRPLVDGVAVGVRESETVWSIELPPYGIIGAVVDQPRVALGVTSVRLPPGLRDELNETLSDLRNRAAALKRPNVLPGANLDFEKPLGEGGFVPNWIHARGERVNVSLVGEGHNGSQQALRVASRGPEAWVRSQILPAPTTGRITVWARLRIPDEMKQPELRLAIEGRKDGRPYYRFANVGAGVDVAAIGTRWAPFILQIDDLPREGLDEFRIGFDLMGAGEVWIDDVVIYDLSFTDKEQFQISRLIAAADFHIHKNNLAAAAQVLDGYWPRFLQEQVEPLAPEIAEPAPRPQPAPPRDEQPAPEEPRQSFLHRARGWWPF